MIDRRCHYVCCLAVAVWIALGLGLIAPSVLAQSPSPHEGLATDAAARYAEGDTQGAIVLYRQMADRATTTPARVEALMNVAWLEHQEGRDSAAINALTEALTLDPTHPFRPELYTDDFGRLFDRGQERARQQRAINVAEMVERGLRQRSSGNFDAARQSLQEASALQPNTPEILLNLALLDLDQGREDDALGSFERILALASGPGVELQPSHRAYALAKVGYLYNRREQYDEAARHLEEAVTLTPDDAKAWSNLGVARQQLAQTSAAAEAFRKAVELDPDDAVAVSNLALAYLDGGQANDAAQVLAGAHRRWPRDASLQLLRGRALEGQGDRAAAQSAFASVVNLDPTNQQGHAATAALYLARLAQARNDPDRTTEWATKATQWDPSLVDGWVLQGVALRTLGQSPEALQRFEEALRRDPTRADLYLQTGSIYYQLRQFDRAETAFRRALEIDPTSSPARDNLAAVRARKPLSHQPPSPASGATSTPGTTASGPPPSTASNSANGRSATRPELGLQYAEVNYGSLGLDGVMIAAVKRLSPADRAGLRPNDLILKVDGRTMASPSDLERYLYTETRAVQFTIDLLRDNRPLRAILRME